MKHFLTLVTQKCHLSLTLGILVRDNIQMPFGTKWVRFIFKSYHTLHYGWIKSDVCILSDDNRQELQD